MSLQHGRFVADAEFLGLRVGPTDGRFTFTVDSHLARFDRGLYGGAAVAVSLAVIDRVTDRGAVWVTTQFVSMAKLGADIEVHAEVLAAGRRTSQVGTFERCPTVTAPASAPIGFPAAVTSLDVGWHTARACNVLGAGTSLDNPVRVGTAAETEWVLLDMRPHLAAGGYGHGSVHLWTEDGRLLATASQTAAMVELGFDPLTHAGRS